MAPGGRERRGGRGLAFAGLAAAVCLASVVLAPARSGVRAFDDDLCLEAGATAFSNCYARNERCTTGNNSTLCVDWAKLMYARLRHPLAARSMLHLDSTFVIAQAVGFSFHAAYWLAAYDEGADKGQYIPMSRSGQLLNDTRLWPIDLTGVNRYHLCAGGSEFHYPVANARPDAPLNGSAFWPNVTDFAAHGQLAHTRAWALGQRTLLCVNGITAPREPRSRRQQPGSANLKDQGTTLDASWFRGDRCYCGGNAKQRYDDGTHCASRSALWKVSFLGVHQWELDTYLGDTRLSFDHPASSDNKFDPADLARYERNGCPTHEFTNVTWAADMAAAVRNGTGRFAFDAAPVTATANAAHSDAPVPLLLARFGVYLHELQDVISHWTCYAHSSVTLADGGDVRIDYSHEPGMCDTGNHVLHHYWETAQPSGLWPSTAHALRFTYVELAELAWRVRRVEPRLLDHHRPTVGADELIGTPANPGPLLRALALVSAEARVQAFAAVQAERGLKPLPGW